MKAKCPGIDAFELWCQRRLLWTVRRSNQSVLKEIKPEYSLKGLMLKLKLQYFGHLMQRTDSLEKILMLGKIEGKRGRERQRIRWSDGITDSMDMNQRKLWGIVKDRETWCAAVHGVVKSRTRLRDFRLTALIFQQSKGLSRVFSSTTFQKHQFFSAQPSLWSNSHIHTQLLEKPQL